MMIRYQTFKVFLLVLLIPFILVKAQNCINYTGGIGEFETLFPVARNFFYSSDDKQGLSTGLWNYNFNNNPKLKIITNLDQKEKASGLASQQITVSKQPFTEITSSNTPYVLIKIPTFDSNEVNDYTRNFYPKIGDVVSSSIKIKTSDVIQNIRYQIRVTARYYKNGNPDDTYHQVLASFITTSPLTNWQTINFSVVIPPSSEPEYQKLDTLYQRIEFYFPSATSSSRGTFWLDQSNFFVKRNNECLKWPIPYQSSLRIFDVYSLEKPRDFVASYLKQAAHLGFDYSDLIVKNYDPKYKYFPYLNLTPLTRYFSSKDKGWVIKNEGEFNSYLDEIKFVTTTGNCSRTMFILHPNARYPEFLKTDNDLLNNYKIHGCLDDGYAGTITNYTDPRLLDKYLEFISRFESYFINPKLKHDAIFFDNLSTANQETSRQTPTMLDVKKNFLEFLNFLNRKIAGRFKYFGNWGYSPYIDKSNIFDLRNYYLAKNLVNGYLDEGWLLFPNDINNLNNSYNPQTTHLIFKTVIENQNYDYILLIGAFNENKCTSTDSKTMFMIASFYLVNNNNTYFALRPISPLTGTKESYRKPQCFDNSLYLPLGKPLKAETIEDLVIASTSNGALYLRQYERGLVLLNSSGSDYFQYQLKVGNPFKKYLDHLGRSYTTSTTINLVPQSGLILYAIE